jgi:hypothetical protein
MNIDSTLNSQARCRLSRLGRWWPLLLVLSVVSLGCRTKPTPPLGPPPPATLVGSWKGAFLRNNQLINIVYQFNADGSFVAKEFDAVGRQMGTSHGRCGFANNQMTIHWSSGGFETASVNWTGADQFNYRISDHTEEAQIGLPIVFQRLP